MMVDPKLLNWIKSQQALGHSSHQIYGTLIQHGYTRSDAGNAVMSVAHGGQAQQPAKKSHKSLLLIAAGILLLAIIGGAAIYFILFYEGTPVKVNVSIETDTGVNEECTVDSDCLEGEMCFARACFISLDEFYSEYSGCCNKRAIISGVPECELVAEVTDKIEDCSNINCENCVNGVQKCITSQKGEMLANYCADCLIDSECKSGYVCKAGLCVES